MRDLALWRALERMRPFERGVTDDEAELIALLDEVAVAPDHVRAPFFADAARLARHGSPKLRVSALRLLRGAAGRSAVIAILEALGADHPGLQPAALDALRACGEPSRFAYALLHPNPSVRMAAVADPPPNLSPAWLLALVPDPALAEPVKAKLGELLSYELPPHAPPLALLSTLLREGHLSPTEAAGPLLALPWADFAARLIGMLPNANPPEAGSAEALEQVLESDEIVDTLEHLIDAMWDGAGAMFEELCDESGAGRVSLSVRLRLGWAALRVGARRGHEHLSALILATTVLPETLGLQALTPEVRSAIIQGIPRAAPRRGVPGLDPFARLAGTPLLRKASGSPDLEVIGTLLHLCSPDPYSLLTRHFSHEELEAAIRFAQTGADILLAIAPEPEAAELHEKLAYAFLCAHAELSPRRLATAATFMDPDKLIRLLIQGDSRDALRLAVLTRHLLNADAEGRLRISSKRKGILLERLAAAITKADMKSWLEELAGHPGRESDLSALFLGEVARAAGTAAFSKSIAALDSKHIVSLLPVIDASPALPAKTFDDLLLRLARSKSPRVRAWREARRRPAPEASSTRKRAVASGGKPRKIRVAEKNLIASCPLTELDSALAPLFDGPVIGLTEALARRSDPEPHLGAAAAILASKDPLEDVVCALAAWSSPDQGFVQSLHALMVKRCLDLPWLGLAGHAWLYRWDKHLLGFGRQLGSLGIGPAELLEQSLTFPVRELRRSIWLALEQLFTQRGARLAAPTPASNEVEGIALVAARSLTEMQLPAADLLATALGSDLGSPLAKKVRAIATPQLRRLEHAVLRTLRRVVGIETGLPDNVQAGEVAVEEEPRIDPRIKRLETLLDRFRDGDDRAWRKVVELVHARCDDSWFCLDHWEAVCRSGVRPRQAARDLCSSPHPAIWETALDHLISRRPAKVDLEALHAFLDAGADRPRNLRVRAAQALLAAGDARALPIVLSAHILLPLENYEKLPTFRPGKLLNQSDEALHYIARAVTALGSAGAEDALVGEANSSTHDAWKHIASIIVEEAVSGFAVQEASKRLNVQSPSTKQLRRLAEVVVSGLRKGQILSGRLFGVRFIGGDLGYTRLETPVVYVNPRPLLCGDREGKRIVRGLILHEIGHHMYHASPEGLSVWKTAREERIQELLNLVMDEHLERNLRALDEATGDDLKILAAWAMQHSETEKSVELLFSSLGTRVGEALIGVDLGVARSPKSVAINGGGVLRQLELGGSSFARFFRALRMGLGNRHADPKVDRALKLFPGKTFRRADVARLLEIAHEIKDIFADEIELLRLFDLHLGDGRDGLGIHPERVGVTEEDLLAEIDKLLKKEEPNESPLAAAPLNLDSSKSYPPMEWVTEIRADRALHAAMAKEVMRPARRLATWFEELGLRLEPRRHRVRGRALDRPRLARAVLVGDPRMLVAREAVPTTDLFIGVMIDCSGSMVNLGIDLARRFGVLIAEASRGMRGVDARFFGFTDRIIYDAGDQHRCGVAALEAGGGNNDAAALAYAARVARSSRRHAKLLVMISDGLPTECSVEALKQEVRETTRQGIACAQVAVRPLQEICFPNYVEIDGSNEDEVVSRFGRIVSLLVARTLRGGG